MHVAAALALLSPGAAQASGSPSPLSADPPTNLPRPGEAEIDDALAISGTDIAAEKLRTRMTVPVIVNGRGPYRFVVDSGADTSVVGERLASALALPSGSPAFLIGVTENAWINRAMVDRFDLGPSSVSNLEVPVLKDLDIGAEGMVGLDALVDQRLVLDFERRTISIDDRTRPAAMMDGEIVVTARLRRGQLILTRIRAGLTPVEAVIDTGSEATIGNLALRNRLRKRFPDRFGTIELQGVTGVASKLEAAVIPELKMGQVTLRNVPIAFGDLPPFKVFGMRDRPALLLGTDLMETFRKVSLDFAARKVRFQLRQCEPHSVVVKAAVTRTMKLSADGGAVCAR
ncbi:hypothetical protein GCM10011515_21280 [Tsuneonella deserti]|uniref:Peptidase A2 domain-containing protein n=2 Tax=Tsuneonella deserti TaxID=2035528 RepID=A0ABQ1S9K8_9SPHN|nr:hypothetical protein GCM10011515_21280 [Tsuneonella deserti]